MALSHRQQKTKKRGGKSACLRVGSVRACLSAISIVVTGSALADFAPSAVKFCVGSMEVVQFTALVPTDGCSLLQLRRQNELQHQHQHQHQQDLSRPAGPGRWQPTHMRCGAFFVPVCEHCYHGDCEGECLEDDPCLHGW